MARTKTVTNRNIPTSRQDLVDKIAELGRHERMRSKIEVEMNNAIAKIKQRHEEEVDPINKSIKSLTAGITAFCEVHRSELTDNEKVKTVNLPSGTVSWRKCPPSVRLTEPEKIIKLLKDKGLEKFIRVKEEVNKDLILSEQAAVAGVKGIAIVKEKEELAIEPFEVKLDAVA